MKTLFRINNYMKTQLGVILVLGALGMFVGVVVVPALEPPNLPKREQALKDSIERLTAQRETIHNELIALKQEAAALRAQIETAKANDLTVTIKISLPPGFKPGDVKVEAEK